MFPKAFKNPVICLNGTICTQEPASQERVNAIQDLKGLSCDWSWYFSFGDSKFYHSSCLLQKKEEATEMELKLGSKAGNDQTLEK